MPLLQIEVQGTDAAGNIASGTVEVEVDLAPAAVIPPAAGASLRVGIARQAGPQPAPAAPPAEVQAQAPLPRMMEKSIPGLGNESGHGGAVPRFTPPVVTQASRSMTLLRNTGGFR